MDSDRRYAVVSKLTEYVGSPSLKHIRDPRNLNRLAQEIVRAVDRAGSIWGKWEGAREEIVKAAAPCWIPTEDLQAFLNHLPGSALTDTDVKQRLRAIWEESYGEYPNEELKAGCAALYEVEKTKGTEMTAIIGAIREHIEIEEDRLRREQEDSYRRLREQEKVRLQQRFLAGADCGWTPIDNSAELYCRRNGRAFRIVQGKDKRWKLYRIKTIEDEGVLIGTYQTRRDANQVLKTIAYQPEEPW